MSVPRATLTLLTALAIPVLFRATAAETNGPTAAFAPAASSWPVVASDLPPDPALRQGTLANGLRYLILPNAEPKGRVSLRLLVDAGSLHERDDELGLAHFVEHMAFRGTRGFPDGTLTTALQRIGVGLGPESTAFTSFEYTIYHLELAEATEASLHEGLRAFREYAEAITFDSALIEKERGVVLSELASRDTPQSRAVDANIAFLWPRALEVQRKTIGRPAAIRSFTREQFVAFYDAWYRPDRMAIIIVGDLEASTAESSVRSHFDSLTSRAPARALPENFRNSVAGPPNVRVYSDPGLVGAVLNFEHPIHSPRVEDTHARRVHDLQRSLAFGMFHARLARITQRPDATFISPSATVAGSIRDWQVASLTVSAKIADWQRAAADIEQEHRRAFQFGFNTPELEEARTAFTAYYEQAARMAPTRQSSLLAQQLAEIVLSGGTFSTLADIQKDIASDLGAVTTKDCTTAFRETWSSQAPSVYIAANPAFNITRDRIAATLNLSRNIAVTPPAEISAVHFAYTDFGTPGSLAHSEHLADLDVRLAAFANGVRLNFKSTQFESDIVEVHVRIGDGKLSQPESQPGLDYLASAVLMSGGLGRHTAQDVSTLLVGRALGISFYSDTDACVFSLRCAPRELAFGLQLVTAYLTDAAYRPDAMRDARASFNSVFASLASSAAGPISMHAPRMVAGDRRFGIPEYDELFSRDLMELRTWLEPQFKNGPIELSIVGDITWEEAAATVARTLGALPARRVRESAPGKAIVPPAPPSIVNLYGIDPKQKQCAIAWYWPVTVQDIHETRRCHLLSLVVAERFRQRLREELGASYSPAASFVEVKGFPHLNYFVISAEMEPARAKQAMEIFSRETQSLAAKGPTADEFTRAKQPYLREMTDNLRTNVYWGVTVLSDVQQHPERLAAARDRATDIAAITREEIAALSRRHLTANRAFRFATVPGPTVVPQRR